MYFGLKVFMPGTLRATGKGFLFCFGLVFLFVLTACVVLLPSGGSSNHCCLEIFFTN